MWSDVITLKKVVVEYVGTFPVETTEEKEVYAKRHSVVRSEFYAAQSVGMKTEIAFTVRRADYDGQTEVEHGGITYNVVREYEIDSENVDLTCARR